MVIFSLLGGDQYCNISTSSGLVQLPINSGCQLLMINLTIRFYLNILLPLWTNLCHLAFRTDCMFLHVVVDDDHRRPRTFTRKLQRLTLCGRRSLHRSAWLDPAKLVCLPVLQSVQPRTYTHSYGCSIHHLKNSLIFVVHSLYMSLGSSTIFSGLID